MRRGRIVEVSWLDTVGISHGWQSAGHYRSEARPGDLRGSTVGYVLRSDRHGVLVAQSVNRGCGKADAAMMIPRGAIQSIRRLS